jgi:uncharacterized phage-like protein YoqJ
VVPNRGAGLVSDDIDRALSEKDMAFTLAEQPYRLPRQLRATAPYVLPRSTRNRVVFYDALCSNEICRFQRFRSPPPTWS